MIYEYIKKPYDHIKKSNTFGNIIEYCVVKMFNQSNKSTQQEEKDMLFYVLGFALAKVCRSVANVLWVDFIILQVWVTSSCLFSNLYS